MSAVSSALIPFYGQYPAGYSASKPAVSTTPASEPADIVDIRSRITGGFTAAAGDTFSVGDLFKGTAPSGGSIAGYKVALRGDGTGGQLQLDGQDVTAKQSFTADEFDRLHFIAGPAGSSQDLVVVAQSGKRIADGTLVNEVDSPAVQITASITGTRSINAVNALRTQPDASDAAFIGIAQQAGIFTGFGAARPGLTTVGNLTAAANDTFSLGDLFKGTAPTGGSIVGYKVALRGDGTGGQLQLDGQDVTAKQSFTADEFDRLHFIAGPAGSSQDLVVVAQSGKRIADGTLVNEVDSPAVEITASVTGTRSINAVNALRTQPGGSDAAFIGIAQQASIFTGFGAARPGLTTVGNLTSAANDTFSLGDLFKGTAPSGGSIVGYKVALRGDGTGGQLQLDGQDVTAKQSFTADEFDRLHFIAGPAGSSQDLVVVAQSGKRIADGTLVNEIDSPAVQITASATGTRSINAVNALRTQPDGSDAAFIGIAQQASIFTGFGAARPGLTTLGNLTAAANDTFSLGDLFKATAPTGGSIVGYKVALRGDGTGGQLQLDGQDVTAKQSFTADEFDRLHFIAGPAGSSQDLVVVAQSGKRIADGTLVNEVDSPAVEITASATGTRSINAVNALRTQPGGSDAAFIGIAQQASIFTGFGAARPGLATVGNLTAAANDTFSLGDLFKGTAPSGSSIVGYKVALRGDGTGGQLQLDGQDVTAKQGFTADEFDRLHFIAGPAGSSQDLVVVAQSGKRIADGTLVNEVDSPAVEITARVTGTRSINAVNALRTQPGASDAAFVGIAQQASIFTGFGAARPSLTSVGVFAQPAADITTLDGLLGAFQSTEPLTATATALESGFAGATGQSQLSSATAPSQTQTALTWALAAAELGGFQSAGSSQSLQRLAVAAYRSTLPSA